eukprot:7346134-Prorocentrum_lima.AAC.1
MTSSLVGSEMCIRDSTCGTGSGLGWPLVGLTVLATPKGERALAHRRVAVSYTHLTLPTICSV